MKKIVFNWLLFIDKKIQIKKFKKNLWKVFPTAFFMMLLFLFIRYVFIKKGGSFQFLMLVYLFSFFISFIGYIFSSLANERLSFDDNGIKVLYNIKKQGFNIKKSYQWNIIKNYQLNQKEAKIKLTLLLSDDQEIVFLLNNNKKKYEQAKHIFASKNILEI